MADSMKNIVALLLLFNWALIVTHGLPAAGDTCSFQTPYNATYPITTPIKTIGGTKYRIAIISDLDKDSIKGNSLVSYLKKGYLTYDGNKKVSLEWDKGNPDELTSENSAKGRGMELSELVTFNGKLFSMDDKTGIIYELDDKDEKIYTWIIMPDGNGRSTKGLKGEWATVKDGLLYVGSHGKEQTDKNGKIEHYDMQWIKTISPVGEIRHINWKQNYDRLRHAVGADFPGYLTHESCVWSAVHKRWFFLPRKMSDKAYSEKADESMGTNILLSCNADFSNITVTRVGPHVPTHGFASFKFIPGSNDNIILALKSEETDKTASFVMAFTINGEMLIPETEVAKEKYEGIEFI